MYLAAHVFPAALARREDERYRRYAGRRGIPLMRILACRLTDTSEMPELLSALWRSTSCSIDDRNLERTTVMTESLVTDVLVIGEGCAGQIAALAASEEGCDVTLLGHGRPPSTAISTGFFTFAAHDGFTRDQLFEAMSQVTGKGLCDSALLARFLDESPKVMADVIAAYGIPVDKVDRGLRARRATGKSGRDLLFGLDFDYAKHGTVEDVTGLMMEFSSTHGTALYAQLRKAVKASPNIRRVKGSARVLEPGSTLVGALVDCKPVTIAARAIILATGGIQGLYEFTDNAATLIGDGHGMAVEAGAALVDIEFMQFYPLSVRVEGVPTIFLYPDFPKLATLINDKGENVLVQHLGEGAKYFAGLANWDQLAILVQTEIVGGREVYVDFRETKSTDWAPDSLTRSFLSDRVPTFMNTPVRVAPSAHYTVGGLKVDVNGRSSLPNVYAVGEMAGGLHGANRHGGVALVDAITFGRIAGQHAARNLSGKSARSSASLLPPSRKAGRKARFADLMANLRRTNQFALGPIRDGAGVQSAGERFAEFREEVVSFGWNDYAEMQEVLRVQRAILLSDCMRRAMFRRTESRGVHCRSDFPNSKDAWLKKQVVTLRDGEFHFDEIAV
jgi:succinate dehydrogenase / fumarate reductase, flavoprotein subunit